MRLFSWRGKSKATPAKRAPVVAVQRKSTKIAFGKRNAASLNDPHSLRLEIGAVQAKLDATPNDGDANRMRRSLLNSRLIELRNRQRQSDETAQESAWSRSGRHALAIVVSLGIGAACVQVVNLVSDPAGRTKLVRVAR